jgi:hypothetical protein
MLVQATTPRPLFNLAEYPEYVRIHALRKAGVSKGSVFFSVATDVEHGNKMTVPLDPLVVYDVDGETGFSLMEYVIPFDKIYATVGRDITMALLGAGGYHVTVHSAFRADSRMYSERVLSFQLLLPVTGGGIIRLGGDSVDITNPTLNPRAPTPSASRNLELADALNRTHGVPKNASDIEKRRAARLAAAKASEDRVRAEEGQDRALPQTTGEIPALPESTEREPE